MTFADAEAMLDMCRNELLRCGLRGQAEALKGLEVLGPTGAGVALMTLENLPDSRVEEAEAVKRYTIAALMDAVRAHNRQLAA